MPLSDKQIKFINEQVKGKTAKEIRDMIGLLYKDNIRKFIKEKRQPQSIKEILKKLRYGYSTLESPG
jgi:hypothetical protein